VPQLEAVELGDDDAEVAALVVGGESVAFRDWAQENAL
jgi:hypothetical protein